MSSLALSENSRILRMEPRDVLDHLRQLLRAEDEHGEDHERHQLECVLCRRTPCCSSCSSASDLRHGTRPPGRRARTGSTVPGGQPSDAVPAGGRQARRSPNRASAVTGQVLCRRASRSRPSWSPGRWLRILTISSSPLCTALAVHLGDHVARPDARLVAPGRPRSPPLRRRPPWLPTWAPSPVYSMSSVTPITGWVALPVLISSSATRLAWLIGMAKPSPMLPPWPPSGARAAVGGADGAVDADDPGLGCRRGGRRSCRG